MKVRAGHLSLQFSDTNKQQTSDIERAFDRAVEKNYFWFMGTEAGDGAPNNQNQLIKIGREHDFRMFVPGNAKHGPGSATDCWIAVRESMITKNWETDYIPAIPGSQELYRSHGLDPDLNPRWGPKGVVTAAFTSIPEIGDVNLGVAHYLTKSRNPKHSTYHGVNHWLWNKRLAETIGDWATEAARGRSLAFYSGDQNMSDDKNNLPQGDTFFGQPLTSMGDELKHWENTGHGAIDVIASYNRDGRVTAKSFRVLDDSEFKLNTDHYLLEGVFDIAELKG